MYYPSFTKVIVNFFMTKDSSIPRRNRVNWHFAREDPMFTMIKVVSRHEDTQLYGSILPDELTNKAIKDFESYKGYYVIASGAEPPKTKASVKKKQARSDKTKTPPTAKGKRLKTSAKAAKPAKKKQPTKTSKAKGLTVLSEVTLTEAEQMKLATKRSLIQTHSSHASGSGADEGTGGKPGVPDIPTYGSDDEQISWKSSDEENGDDDDADNQDNDGQDDNEERQDEEDNEEEGSDLRIQTPSHYESTDDEESDEVTHGANVEGEELDEEETNEEDEANELYRDVNSSSVLSGLVSNMLNPSPDTGIDSIFNLNTESTSLVDVPITTIAETPLSSATTLPPPPVPLITHLQQTLVPPPTTVPSSSLQDLPNFAVSSIPGIIDTYLANKMNETKIIKEQVKEQVKAQVSKILPKIKKTVNEQLEAEVLTRSSNESKTSHVVAANLSELELKKIIIDKMESNKSIYRSDEQKNLYKAFVDTYKSDKLILDTYRDIVSFKRRRDDEDKDEEPSAGSNQGSKRRRAGKEPESTSAPKEKTSKIIGKSTEGSKSHHKFAQVEEPMHTAEYLEEPAHQEFDTGFSEDQPVDETTQHRDWFQKLTKPPTLDRDWNKTLHANYGPIQPWISSLAKKEDTHDSFNELMDTPLDFSAFVMNRLKVDTLTPELLVGPTFELMKGLCKSLVELVYFLKEVYKATTDQLDWNNPKGQQYPHDIRKPLPLIPNSQGQRIIPFAHFINNDLEYLRGGTSSQTYATSVMKTKAADYGHVKWIEDLHLDIEDIQRRRLQDIKDMLLLLVQGKLINLTIEERLALNVSLRMFTRSIVIQRRVEDLQLEACSDSAELESCRAEKAAPMLNSVPQQVKQKDCKPADRENDRNVNRSRKRSNECRFPGEKMDQHARGDNNKNSRPLKKRAEEVNDADNKSSKDENPTSIQRVVESAINHLT
ncbi:hypothetical protein Tco_1039527, partial [Tanacetum coccineum]